MKLKTIINTAICSLLLVSCSDWTEMESVRIDVQHPWDQDPELWDRPDE